MRRVWRVIELVAAGRAGVHSEAPSQGDSEIERVVEREPDVCAGHVHCMACLCTAITRVLQEERAFLEQEHDDRANILATRVVTTGGVMQVQQY